MTVLGNFESRFEDENVRTTTRTWGFQQFIHKFDMRLTQAISSIMAQSVEDVRHAKDRFPRKFSIILTSPRLL